MKVLRFRMVVVIVFFLILSLSFSTAAAFEAIYSGQDTVDLHLGLLSGRTRWMVYRDNFLIYSRDGSELADGTTVEAYHADTGCEAFCTYRLEGWENTASDGQEPKWELRSTQETQASTTVENGTLHNSPEWALRLGRNLVAWGSANSAKTYRVKMVAVADGDLPIHSAEVFFEEGGKLYFTNGATLSATGADFSDFTDTDAPHITFSGAPENTNSMISECTFEGVNLSMIDHTRAFFSGNTLINSDVDLVGADNASFDGNAFTDTKVWVEASDDVSLKNNSLTNSNPAENSGDLITLVDCNKPVFGNNLLIDTGMSFQTGSQGGCTDVDFQGNDVQDSLGTRHVQFYTTGALIKGNKFGTESVYVSGSEIIFEGNELHALTSYGGHASTFKGNTFDGMRFESAGGLQILENQGKRLAFDVNVGNATIKGNLLSCWNDVGNGDDGLILYGKGEYSQSAQGNVIEGNKVEWCINGIHLYDAKGNTVKGNTLSKCGHAGIWLENSSENQIENNAVNQTGFAVTPPASGILIGNLNGYSNCSPPDTTQTGSKRNVVAYNTIWDTHGNGIDFPVWPYGNDANGIHENTISESDGWAIHIGGNVTSTCCDQKCQAKNLGNFIYNNAFLNNVNNVSDIPENLTVWNHAREAVARNIVGGTHLGGNYWDDYTGADADGDWMGDSAHVIRDASGNVLGQDDLPLTSNQLTRILVVGAGDSALVRFVSEGEPEGAAKYIDSRWHKGINQGDNRQVFTAGDDVDFTIRATGGFGVAVHWTGCDGASQNGTEEALCHIRGRLPGGDRRLTAHVVKTPYKFIRKWGTQGTGDGQFSYPKGVAVDVSGNVYVADRNNHRIQKFTATGQFLAKWGTQGTGNGQFQTPNDVAVDSLGNVYVADAGNYRIQKFDRDGNHLASWGSQGVGSDQFGDIQAIALDATGENLYVVDYVYANSTYIYKAKVFSGNGQFVRAWSLDASFSNRGTGVALGGAATGDVISPQGYAYVSQTNYWGVGYSDVPNFGIVSYRPSDGLKRVYFPLPDGMEAEWPTPGSMNETCQLAMDRFNHLYVVDYWNPEGQCYIQKFSHDGYFIDRIGGPCANGDGQFKTPHGIAVDQSGNIYVSGGADEHRIQVFSAAPTPPVEGDINMDGKGDLADAILALRIAVGIDCAVPPLWTSSGTDVDGDEQIGVAEVLYILQKMTSLR